MATSQDTEITLGTGKLLVFFFALVVVCALFFGLGFSLGRNASGSPSANQASLSAGTERPQAGSATSQKPSSDMSFYKSVKQKSPDAQLATPEAATPANPKATEAKPPADPMTPPALSGYLVQVAAVTNRKMQKPSSTPSRRSSTQHSRSTTRRQTSSTASRSARIRISRTLRPFAPGSSATVITRF